ncbi:MAG TPA: zf-TFIIB domain-containing protein [Polyangiaceae bacterium]|jgi:Zn-finger nucleic acid-binding protein|nr:zf-TFIIB domain-containing protein [Polyangiaceae bacterium]
MLCPSCCHPLAAAAVGGEVVDQCEGCGGEYCSREALRELLAKHSPPAGMRGEDYRRPSPFLDPVRYRKCPVCDETMQRNNFGQSSGVVVDVCAIHGTWFDRGELATIIEFVATGAMAVAEKLAAERAVARKNLDAFATDLNAVGPRHYFAGLSHMSSLPLDSLDDIAWAVRGSDRRENEK